MTDFKLMIDAGDEEVNVRLERGETLALFVKAVGKHLVVGGVGDGGELRLQKAIDEVLEEERAVRDGSGNPLQGEQNSRERIDTPNDGGLFSLNSETSCLACRMSGRQ